MSSARFYLSAPSVSRVINSECATLKQASLLLADRYANGQAFPEEFIVDNAHDDLVAALESIVNLDHPDAMLYHPSLKGRTSITEAESRDLCIQIARAALATAEG